MVLKLYGYGMSASTQRVATVLHEKNVPFKFIPVDLMTGEHQTPAFMEKQPFGLVPYIDDDGFILYESRAICHYIATKYSTQGTPLLPTELKANALAQQAISIETTTFNDFAGKAVYEKIVKPMRGLTVDQAYFDSLMANLSLKFDVYDQILSKQKYLAGDEITLADLYHLPYGAFLTLAGSDIMSQKPNVSKWYKELCSRPSWVAVKDGVVGTA